MGNLPVAYELQQILSVVLHFRTELLFSHSTITSLSGYYKRSGTSAAANIPPLHSDSSNKRSDSLDQRLDLVFSTRLTRTIISVQRTECSDLNAETPYFEAKGPVRRIEDHSQYINNVW